MNEDKIERYTPWGTPVKELNEELQSIFDEEKSPVEETNEENAQAGDEATKTQAEASEASPPPETKGGRPIHPGDINDLTPAVAAIVRSATGHDTEKVTLSFENVDGELDLLVDNGCCVTPVLFVRMKGNELHVGSSDNDWHIFKLKRLPADWSKLLPENVLFEVKA